MDFVVVGRSEGIVTVTLTAPAKKNAIPGRGWAELRDTFLAIADEREDRVVVVRGSGDDFCSGADLSDPEAAAGMQGGRGTSVSWMRVVGQAALALHELPKPTIAAVHGVAAGAGLNLALGCDLILAADDARFSEIFSRRGLNLDFGGTWLLPRLIGLHKAKEFALFGDVISAKEAEGLGVVNRIVPAGELDATVAAWAQRLAALPPINVSIIKKALNNALSMSMSEALEFEALAQNVAFSSADTAEAMIAWIEKREPRFRGE
jgi:2-(1,2-epoxy-1,2-dihydrophenyl)acetyl-CoA isomerase